MRAFRAVFATVAALADADAQLVGPRRLPSRGAVLELLDRELDVVSALEVLHRADEFPLEVRVGLDDPSRD